MKADDLGSPENIGTWAAEGRLPEMLPARQSRSIKTAAALIDAGRRLLREMSLEDLSIDGLCEAAGTTVGAFYGRFGSKGDFFVTMQRVQTIRTEQAIKAFIARHPPGESSLEKLCADIVRETVENFRTNLGVMRASLQHSREGMWKVIKESGDRYRVMLVRLLSPYLVGVPPAQRELRILFAYHALAGVLVHAVLNDPGPLGLEDKRIERELLRLIHSYLAAT
ncbi:MAG TPA: TetR/AcrR family transcriptional regulator [Ramlibacter sp.]|uniref:TetR/AcrR family transcriptional regulator n=1 Tax=Ramlibacter sp. TaxID=1917967 RepID=UPI002CA29595|nr:TetR/AcrR family transcriptional regulator [Ramlibacter sp.]HVZ47089.1 TetR/AcrR family transcriptional regulator [Ramlibacter sp.]